MTDVLDALKAARKVSGACASLLCCDAECAGANHCRIGGYQCDRCGCWFCADELDSRGLCDECREALREEDEQEEEEFGTTSGEGVYAATC